MEPKLLWPITWTKEQKKKNKKTENFFFLQLNKTTGSFGLALHLPWTVPVNAANSNGRELLEKAGSQKQT